MYRKTSLQKVVKEYKKWQGSVQEMKNLSDVTRSQSKKAATLLRRDHLKEARLSLREAERALKSMSAHISRSPRLSELGFYKDALEEYVEAVVYDSYLSGKRVTLPPFVKTGMAEVIGGVCDMTGELVRRAITIASSGKIRDIEKYRDYVQGVVDQFSQVSFTGKLRSKYDDVERNVKRLEQILYDLRIKNNQ